MNLHWQLCGNF